MKTLVDKLPRAARVSVEPASEPGRVRRRLRILLVVLLGLVLLGVGFRQAVHTVPWVGPVAANLLRRLIGGDAVTRLEELSAATEDRFRRTWRATEPPRSIVDVERRSMPAPSSSAVPPNAPSPERFRPADVGPMKPRVAAPGDGVWRVVPDPNEPEQAAILFTTMLHPDARRPWAEVFVVAVDLANVEVYAVAGSVEPKATTAQGRKAKRPGLVAPQHAPDLLAVFNGGFKTEHGQHGMFADGVTFVPAKKGLCTIVGFEDGSLRVGRWETVVEEVSHPRDAVRFFRQAAPCMAENGRLNPALRDEGTRHWGATLEGDTVIRRSALGLDAKRTVMYVAITNDTTATALANAMLHAGATDVAQLDVNWSYPKFVTFPRDGSGTQHAVSLFEGFLVARDDFVRKRSSRDFFYVVTRRQKAVQ